MNVNLLKFNSEKNAVNKDLDLLRTVTGNLRGECNILNPEILVEGIDDLISTVNYVYIPTYARYYFVTDIAGVRTNLVSLKCKVDVLQTYKSDIYKSYGIIARNEHEYDLKLNDGLFYTQQNPKIATIPFPNGFTKFDYILAIAGN